MDTLNTAIVQMERACALLQSAGVAGMDDCAVSLSSTVERLRAWREAQAGNKPEYVAELCRLRTRVGLARTLLERAAAFHEGWAARLRTMAAGYAPTGDPACFRNELRASLSVEG